MNRIGIAERRARLVSRHLLAPSAHVQSAVEAASAVVALHATDPASVYLSLRARLKAPSVQAIETALYAERTLVRMLGMRRTMFVVPTDLAPVVQSACTDAIAVTERRRLLDLLRTSGVEEAESWLAEVETSVLGHLTASGELSANRLAALEPRLRFKLTDPRLTRYGPGAAATTFVLMRLAARGDIVRGRPAGTWTSGQYAWSMAGAWLPRGFEHLEVEAARSELARRWLLAFGPGTVADLKWWTGWPAGVVKAALAKLPTVEVDMDGVTGLALAGDLEPARPATPASVFLPSLDPTVMGWAARGWYLGEHAASLFDRSGNAGPTVWWDGRVIGAWAQRRSGEIAFRLLEDAGREAARAAEHEAARLQAWIGGVRVTPRFRTPLEKELSA